MKNFYVLGLALFFSISAFGQDDKSWTKMGTSKKETFYDVKTKFNKYWKNKTPQKGQGYKIFKRWENQIEDKIYPSGDMSLPANTYPNFISWQKKYNDNLAKNANSQKNALIATSSWVSLNQNAIASGYDSGSGRINFVTFDPINPSTTMYVGAPDGGLWKTTNGGTSWTTNTDYLPIIGCSGLVIDPNNTQAMYLATGDRESDRTSIGVMKSTDGGANWNTTGLVWTVGTSGVADNYRISKIVMDPNNAQVMMVSTDGGVFRTTDGWASSTLTTPFVEAFSDIEFKPGNSNVVYTASTDGSAGYIYKSTDNGVTWATATGIPTSDVQRIELAVTAHDNTYVYAIVGNNDGGLKGVYKSTDSGDTFSLVYETTASTPNILHSDANPPASPTEGWNGGQAFHDLAIVVSPVDKNKITIGGINQWQSTNGGTSWTRITSWLGFNPDYPDSNRDPEPYIHADIIYIEYMPGGNNTTFFTTCDGGISKTTDDGATWTDITANIAVGQQTSISTSATNQDIFFAGLQDIGSLKYNNGSWTVLSGGDGEDGFFDRVDANSEFIVSSTTNGQFFYTTDGGVTSNDIPWDSHPYHMFPDGSETEWFSPIHQDPSNADLVYLGGRPFLYKSSDLFSAASSGTASFEKTGTTAPSPGAKNILRFEIAPSNNSIIYVIKENIISKSTNAGSTWSDISSGLPVSLAKLKNLAISNTDENKVWVVFSGYADGEKVYKTTDGGANWINMSNGLPNIPMNTVVYRNDSVNDEIYVGADLGVYAIDNQIASAVPFLTDLPKCAVQDLEIFYTSSTTGKLRAATYGRGSWETDLSNSTLTAHHVSFTDTNAPILYPNPVSNGILNVKLSNTDSAEYYVYNLIGEQVLKGEVNTSNAVISLQDKSAGAYILRMISKDKIYTQKIIVK
ncbi:T9SS type A sorting domain-containing protein [Algibacter sp. PT7-4]|uniref:T9SS type A sorting domain-containing protein n=1 Tax=Algibacter ulvanivorans TaxID=3400999 RepID=UPI003AAE369A